MNGLINIVVIGLMAYTAIGSVFACYFFMKGAAQLDPLIKDSKWQVRLLLMPGALATWPILLSKLIRSKS